MTEELYIFGLALTIALAVQLVVEAFMERPLKKKVKILTERIAGTEATIVVLQDHILRTPLFSGVAIRQLDTHGDGLKKTEVHGSKGTTKKRRPNKRNAK